MLQWLSTSPAAREIDREPGDLWHDLVASTPLMSSLRYNVDLRKKSVERLDPHFTDVKLIESLSAMDAPQNMDVLHQPGKLVAGRDVRSTDFAAHFDLPED